MSEDVARAVSSNGVTTTIIAGKECTVRPLSLKELGELERQCLKQFKRTYLETYAENADLLPESMRAGVVQAKIDETAKWDVKDLPLKLVYDPTKIRINDKVGVWAKEEYPGMVIDDKDDPEGNKKTQLIQRLVAAALDGGNLEEEEYREMTGFMPNRQKTGYVNWWITGSFDGMLEMIYIAFKHNGVTRDDVSTAVGINQSLMVNLSREIEHLTAPQSGNT